MTGRYKTSPAELHAESVLPGASKEPARSWRHDIFRAQAVWQTISEGSKGAANTRWSDASRKQDALYFRMLGMLPEALSYGKSG